MIRACLLAALWLTPGIAGAAPLAELIEEKTRATLGLRVPDTAAIRVAFTAKPVDEAMVLSAFWMDEGTGQFLANAVTEAGGVHRIGGVAVVSVPVTVPTRSIMPGEIIGAGDLESVDLPLGRIGAFTLSDPESLIGKEVKSLLTAGRPVMAQAVQEPLVIARGAEVSIRFSDGQLSLSAPGRALRDAHVGQEVKVVNIATNATVIGVATATGDVEIPR
ncbi:flagellar basal body P-ring formation chaperone FlgA [Litorisediminicola beolgyonensis]|uniref:Flagella basal body P-ring formation protein FlgA n=1 Tax=Litorisediminicola beolgyonensis TaxID=1173614 RepID=A0ABW3ZH29_9RHOB